MTRRTACSAEVFEPAKPIKIRERRSPNWSAAMALAVVAVIVYAVVHAFSGTSHHLRTASGQEKKPTAAASPTPSPTPATPAQRRSVLVQLAATEDCWIGVYAPDGTMESQAYIPAGSTRSWNFTHRVSMKIGNPGGIVLTVNGHRMKIPGPQVTTLSFRPGGTVSG
jgi:hypothetical protein